MKGDTEPVTLKQRQTMQIEFTLFIVKVGDSKELSYIWNHIASEPNGDYMTLGERMEAFGRDCVEVVRVLTGEAAATISKLRRRVDEANQLLRDAEAALAAGVKCGEKALASGCVITNESVYSERAGQNIKGILADDQVSVEQLARLKSEMGFAHVVLLANNKFVATAF